MIKIYALIDPRDGVVRYIGQTVQPLYNRLANHVDKARRGKDNTPKSEWIREILACGKRPLIKLLCNVSKEQKRDEEAKWIERYKETVLNVAPAGAGGSFDRRFDVDKYKHLLGVLSDGEIATMAGVTRKTVSYHRKKMHIEASNNKRRMKPPPNMGGWNKVELPQEILGLLGKEPDYLLAERLGVSKSVVARARRKQGIKSYAEITGNNGKYKKGNYPARWTRCR